MASRLGYGARGLVYLGVGGIALLAALDLTPRASGASGAIEAWASWPLGLLLIAGVAAGLAAFAAWRFVEAAFDADNHGVSPKGIAIRVGQAISGVVYAALAWSTLELLDGFEDIGEADESDSARTLAAEALALPYGDWILIAVGVALLGVGVGNLVQGAFQDFAKRLDCSDALCRIAVPFARLGYIGRGVATLPAGVFLLRAGLDVRSAEARSWGDALQTLEGQPFGSVILGAVALGLVAFGLFGLFEAVFRRIKAPATLAVA
ncbi:MAG: DUF1206 domain-containing protein [Pseudomonadota bacterium]